MRDYFNEVKLLDILPLKLRKKLLIIGLLLVVLESLSIGFIPLIAIISEGRISFSILNDF